MADLQTSIDAARLLAYRAAWMLSAERRARARRRWPSSSARRPTSLRPGLGMQVLAGHGFATESIMSFRWRESIVATISGGTSQIQRNAVAKSMGLKTY